MINWRGACACLVMAGIGAGSLSAQVEAPLLKIQHAQGTEDTVSIETSRGLAAAPVALFQALGWSVAEAETALALSGPHGAVITMRLGSPFFFWNDEVLQAADAPYREEGQSFVPLQILIDFVPNRMSELYAFDGPSFTLQAADAEDWGGTVVETRPVVPGAQLRSEPDQEVASEDSKESARPAPVLEATPEYSGDRVVIIDPGHGGGDPGAIANGVREKNVALGIGLVMAELLEREPGIKVYITRDDDTFVPIWDRGQQATTWKGEQAGVFISLHANALTNRSVRGFETYFLSEARTDHERRVAAIENAPLQVQGQNIDPEAEPDLGFILRELRTLDHQHWSALLAEFVQEEIALFHPGPNRGVKQGVLAVLTNAVMPSVLVEIGFLSHDDEGPLLAQERFQDEAARSIARAVLRFFERYPPGSGTGGAGEGA